jgi:hypothetical protein
LEYKGIEYFGKPLEIRKSTQASELRSLIRCRLGTPAIKVIVMLPNRNWIYRSLFGI